ncbi:hypothetical protein [Nocardia seriolae]|uniref:Uncharacterized protein n=1 Tax=Nocardia seriolae TaxID=37332 RepID=A0A0B8NH03_9NOCA|nr:hypothetical protein [Nocardia seriolae]APA97075.1 hypothetical protein NS506_03018 [Nocardia seriolae]MTJ65126.1 hypothetical protein [Nocardia seriolae]MTJ71224.1 hypothetical protein [Nocardia seriolae]MTJ86950.1 hypothetical protein [Nocardia seriolae]MTK30945.1 hypothetical protein [Nocardia seriolae]
MTDYLRPMAAYVATWNGHSHTSSDRPGPPTPARVTTPDNEADTTEDTPDNGRTGGGHDDHAC